MITSQLDPEDFLDWEGDHKSIRSKVFSHGWEAGSVTSEDLIPCPVQSDPTKYQREDCARVTPEGAKNFAKLIRELATSTKPGMVKFEMPMPYFDTESAVGHMNLVTGDCVFFHQSGKYWTYKKFDEEGISKLIKQSESISLRLASKNSGPKSEL